MTEYFGVAKMSVVKVPVAGFEYYWIGASTVGNTLVNES